jgi:hypothetical protein
VSSVIEDLKRLCLRIVLASYTKEWNKHCECSRSFAITWKVPQA